MKPTIGNWYRIQGSESFEVVAFDEDDGTIELQYFDGTVEEMDLEDWNAEKEAGALGYGDDEDRRQTTNKLEGLDLFE